LAAEEEAMLKKMMIKEWRERSGVILFALAALVLFALAFTVYSRDKYALDVLAGTLILIFLPVFSLLLGASGFSSEFRDGAWAYLFSRPAKKWRLGLAKYLSLLAILLVVLFLFALLAKVHPALKPVPSAFNFPLLDERMPFGVLAFVFPLLLFTTAFSLSVLSEHPLIVAFLTLLVWTVLPITATLAGFRSSPILEWGMYSSTFWLMFPLVPLSLFLAFLVTLNRSDFSQPRRRPGPSRKPRPSSSWHPSVSSPSWHWEPGRFTESAISTVLRSVITTSISPRTGDFSDMNRPRERRRGWPGIRGCG